MRQLQQQDQNNQSSMTRNDNNNQQTNILQSLPTICIFQAPLTMSEILEGNFMPRYKNIARNNDVTMF